MEGFFKKMLRYVGVVSLVILVEGNSMRGTFNFCTLQCNNDETFPPISTPNSSPTARFLRGKSGLRGEKGARGDAGVKGTPGINYDRSEISNLQNRISQLESNLTNNEGEISKLKNRIYQLESNLTNQIQRIEEIVQKLVPIGDILKKCGIGMQSNASTIEDHQITASSYFKNNAQFLPRLGRLFNTEGWGWCAGTKEATEWIQVDLEEERDVYGIVMQGLNGSSEQLRTYKVLYKNEIGDFHPLTDQSGSTMIFRRDKVDNETPTTDKFPHPITARYFRIHPLTWEDHPCLRIEFLGC